MDKLEAMRVFIEVAECKSFVAASRKLDLSAPAVTRSIAQLEHALDVRLFNRTTRHVRLTDSGGVFTKTPGGYWKMSIRPWPRHQEAMQSPKAYYRSRPRSCLGRYMSHLL